MAFNILEPIHLILFSIMQVEPVWGDLSGGFDQIPDLADVAAQVRANINKKAKLLHAIARDNAAEFKVINGAEAERVLQAVNITPRANFRFEFPDLPEAHKLSQLRDVIDLNKAIIVSGFGKVGLWGSSRKRWEMEISMSGISMDVSKMALHVGWVDTKTGEAVDDKDVRLESGQVQERNYV
ncbi:hypothetical protein BGW80DRAFT_728862 [Lactifluus volemus]|nr:hypothetical protein BGW80DRAFT_728862 [Lactifluus volemus]